MGCFALFGDLLTYFFAVIRPVLRHLNLSVPFLESAHEAQVTKRFSTSVNLGHGDFSFPHRRRVKSYHCLVEIVL